jgi:hypothetical protein
VSMTESRSRYTAWAKILNVPQKWWCTIHKHGRRIRGVRISHGKSHRRSPFHTRGVQGFISLHPVSTSPVLIAYILEISVYDFVPPETIFVFNKCLSISCFTVGP